jgi:hypothetical protein
MKVSDGTNEFDVVLSDSGTDETAITINGREFNFSQDFASMWRTAEGELTVEGLRELAMEVLSSMEGEEYEELVKSPKSLDVRELHTKEKPGDAIPDASEAKEVDEEFDGIPNDCKLSQLEKDGFEGTNDVDLATSLFEYGLIHKDLGDGKFLFIYGTQHAGDTDTPDEYTKFSYANFDEDDFKSVIEDHDSGADVVAKFTGNGMEKWMEFSLPQRVSDLISYYGPEDVFGSPGNEKAIINDEVKESKAQHRGKVVFSAEKSKDKKEHFPINNAGQARNALARSHQYKSVPSWYSGTLKSLQNSVRRAVKAAYPSIEVKESVEFDAKKRIAELKEMKIEQVWVVVRPNREDQTANDLVYGGYLKNLERQIVGGLSDDIEADMVEGVFTDEKEAIEVAVNLLKGSRFATKESVNESKTRDMVDPSRGTNLLKKLLKR